VILARIRLRRRDPPPDPAEIDEAVLEMERELDARFLDEVAPALERARPARPAP